MRPPQKTGENHKADDQHVQLVAASMRPPQKTGENVIDTQQAITEALLQ